MHTKLRTTESDTELSSRTRACMPRAAWMARTAALTVVAAATALHLQAQSTAPAPQSHPYLDLSASLTPPAGLAAYSYNAAGGASSSIDSSSSSTSIDPATDAVTSERLSLSSEATQPPPRRRYGRPRYNDTSHNADGSRKYTFEFGAGFTVPTAGTSDYSKLNYKFQVGAGRNFNRNFGVLAQFDWDNFGIQTSTLNNLLATYNSLGASDQNGNALTQLGGSTHIWSFSINPIYNIIQSEKSGVYMVAGVGFYHKASNITTPVTSTYYDPYYGYYQYPANASIDKYNSNAPGYNGGIGFTYRPSRFSGERFFAEARYVYISNSERPYYAGSGPVPSGYPASYFNVFPQNSATTSYVPITFGLRF